MIKENLRGIALKAFASEFVIEAYQGILGRDGEPEGVESYSHHLRSGGKYADFLTAMCQSEEAWNLAIRRHATDLISAIYLNCLERDADTEAIEAYTELLNDISGFSRCIFAITHSDEAWNLSLAKHSDDIVTDLSKALLKRPATAEELCLHKSSARDEFFLQNCVNRITESIDYKEKYAADNSNYILDIVLRSIQNTPPTEEQKALYSELSEAEGLQNTIKTIVKDHIADLITTDETLSAQLIAQCAPILVKAFYKAILKREADPAGLEAHSNSLSASSDITQCLKNLLASQEYIAVQDKKEHAQQEEVIKNLDIQYKEKLIEHLSSIRLKKDRLSFLLAASNHEKFEQLIYQAKHPTVRYDVLKNSRLVTSRKLALIFVPSEFWLPFCLAIADHLAATQHCESVIVWNDWSPAFSNVYRFSKNVYETISVNDLLHLPKNFGFSPATVICHSFGWLDKTLNIIEKYPSASTFVYADAFKNEISTTISKTKHITGAYYFGYQPNDKEISPAFIIPHQKIYDLFGQFSSTYKFQKNIDLEPNPIDPYAVVYMRYWGTSPYCFSDDDTIDLMYQTIVSSVGNIKNIILKPDKRAKDSIFNLLFKKLADNNYSVRAFGEFISKKGIDPEYSYMPVEYFIEKNILTNATCHVTFDSSLSYTIPTNINTERPTIISIGANFEYLSKQSKENILRSAKSGLNNLIFYSQRYANTALKISGAKLIQKNEHFYVIKFNNPI